MSTEVTVPKEELRLLLVIVAGLGRVVPCTAVGDAVAAVEVLAVAEEPEVRDVVVANVE